MPELKPREQLKSTLRILLRERIILSGSEGLLSALPEPPNEKRSCKRLVFGIAGAVHAVLVVPLIARLRRTYAGHIDVVLTDAAQKFVRPEALTWLGLDVWTDLFSVRDEINVPHIHLASRADLVAIIPASAHPIHRLASGECSDLLPDLRCHGCPRDDCAGDESHDATEPRHQAQYHSTSGRWTLCGRTRMGV